jgi:chemotaxis signal transduction protein
MGCGFMTSSHQDESARVPNSTGAQPPLSLSQLLALARTRTIDEQRTALEQVKRGAAPVEAPEGEPYLLFTCADVACAAPLTQFREVLPTLPTTVALPLSPSWMLGFFALHTELIGLVDPAPFLFDAPELVSLSRARARNGRIIIPGSSSTSGENWRLAAPDSGPTALIVGTGEQMLALAVGAVGDLAYVKPGEVLNEVHAVSSARTPAARFQAGAYTDTASQTVYYVLNVAALLNALMAALMHVEGVAHE